MLIQSVDYGQKLIGLSFYDSAEKALLSSAQKDVKSAEKFRLEV